jgi:hypothetical protein
MKLNTSLTACVVAALIFIAAPRVGAEEPLATARELYASASYDEALTVLNGLMNGDFSREERQSIELYRALCLFAIGRTGEADRAIEKMIAQDPLYRPSADDISPRMRTAFTEARKRLLPSIIQQKYAEAKSAFDQHDYVVSTTVFKQVLDSLADPDMGAVANQSPLADLRTLSVGFHELSAKAGAPPPPPPMPIAAPAPGPPLVAPVAPRVYGAEDANVVPPATIRQQVPAFPGRIAMPVTGILEILIDERGAVNTALMRVPMNPQYDKLVLSAAKSWQYLPATFNGTPVKFVKRVQVSLVPNAPELGTARR